MKLCSGWIKFFPLIFVVFLLRSNAGIVVQEEKGLIKVETQYFKVEINPKRGGRISSFIPRETKNEIIFDKESAGLFVDHFWEQLWPGEFWKKNYQYTIIKKSPEEVSIKLQAESSKNNPQLLSNIIIEKTLTFYQKEKFVKCHIVLKNNDKKGKACGYWCQNIFTLSGSKENDFYVRPSSRCLDIITPESRENFWVYDVISGWTGTIDKKSKEGLVFLMDYNYLQCLYNCSPSCTTEWRYDRVLLPVGKSWETDIYMLYTQNLSSYSHASPYLIADLKVERKEKFIDLIYDFLPSIRGAQKIDVESVIESIFDKKKEKIDGISIKIEPGKIKRVKLKTSSLMKTPLVIHTKVKIKEGIEECFDIFYAGDYLYGKNIKMDMVTPLYQIKPKPKRKTFIKPAKIIKEKNSIPQIFFLKGLFSNMYGIDKKFLNVGEMKVGYYSNATVGPPGLSYFPVDYSELMKYDVFILGNIDKPAIGDAGCEMLKDFVKYGGGLLILGGERSYGEGGFKETSLEEVFPVFLEKKYDLQKVGPLPLKPGEKNSITSNIPFNKLGWVYYLHVLKPKPSAKVLIWAGKYPFMVSYKYGKGKVIAILGTVFGETRKRKIGFWESTHWKKLISDVIYYLWNNP